MNNCPIKIGDGRSGLSRIDDCSNAKSGSRLRDTDPALRTAIGTKSRWTVWIGKKCLVFVRNAQISRNSKPWSPYHK